MDAYPFDLVLAVVIASATVFLGFLPAKTIRPGFFAREAAKATAAWMGVALLSPLSVMHYPFILAVLCFVAWWNFQRNDAFAGKIWFSLAAGLGISIGVMVILAVTPGSLPPQESDWSQAWYLASLYLGGATISLAYVGYILCRESIVQSGLGGFIQNGLGLLFRLTLVRGIVMLIEIVTVPGAPGDLQGENLHHFNFLPVGVGVFLVLPALAWLARRAARFSSRRQPTRLLAVIIVVGFATEVLARIELL